MKKRILSILLTFAILISSMMLMGNTVSAKVASSHGRMPFDDLNYAAWYVEGVEFCYTNCIIKGVNSYTYSPDTSLTRAQFVTMLATLAGANLEEYADVESGFTDVLPEQWFHKAVTWAVSEGYVNGMGGGRFAPDFNITREQLAKLMFVYAEKNGVDVSLKASLNNFTDAPGEDFWSYESLSWSVAVGLINGVTSTSIAPFDSATRAQAARIMMLLMQNLIYGDCTHEYSEATCTEAQTCSVCGLKTGLPLGHDCEVLSCVEGSECQRCGEVLENDPDLHSFADATCTEPRTCTLCGITRGNALGHTTYNGICERCDSEVFPSDYDKIVYYMKTLGDHFGDGLYGLETAVLNGNGTVSVTNVGYATNEKVLTMAYIYTISENDFYMMGMDMYKGSGSYEYHYYHIVDGYLYQGASYTVYPGLITSSSVLSITDYYGPDDYSSKYTNFLELQDEFFMDLLEGADKILGLVCDEDISVLGFTNLSF